MESGNYQQMNTGDGLNLKGQLEASESHSSFVPRDDPRPKIKWIHFPKFCIGIPAGTPAPLVRDEIIKRFGDIVDRSTFSVIRKASEPVQGETKEPQDEIPVFRSISRNQTVHGVSPHMDTCRVDPESSLALASGWSMEEIKEQLQAIDYNVGKQEGNYFQ